MPQVDDNNLIWIDLEMTGLNPQKDVIIEIATLVTDKDLNILAEGPVMAVHQSDADRKSTRLNSSHLEQSRMPSSA